MDFIYTDEFDNYFLTIFKIDGIPFSALTDKVSKEVIDISTLVSGVYNASHPYNQNMSLKEIDWLSVNYFEIEDALVEYFTNEH